MSHAIDEKPFPRSALIAAAGMIAFSIAAAATARLTDFGATRLAAVPAVESRLLSFRPSSPGMIDVYDVNSGKVLAALAMNKFGFIEVVLQGIARDRMRNGTPVDAPLLLTRGADGAARLEDPETKRNAILLNAFGYGNHQAFLQLFDKERTMP